MTERLLSTGDVAEALGVSEATIKRWADAGTLSCIRTPGGHRKFRLRDMAAYLASRTPRGGESPEDEKLHVEQLASALASGDVGKVMAELAPERLQRVPMAELADRWLMPAFSQVVEGRKSGNRHAYQEMMAVHVLQDVTARQKAQVRHPRTSRGKVLIVATSSGAADIWSRFGGLVAIENGYAAQVIGAGLSATDIVRAAEELEPDWCVVVTTNLKESGVTSMMGQMGQVAQNCRLIVAMLGDITDDLPESVQSVGSLVELRDLFVPSALRTKAAR